MTEDKKTQESVGAARANVHETLHCIGYVMCMTMYPVDWRSRLDMMHVCDGAQSSGEGAAPHGHDHEHAQHRRSQDVPPHFWILNIHLQTPKGSLQRRPDPAPLYIVSDLCA
ncbi:uncharacterized protein PGTG_21514 [Puccinia graminis f. sp. tritici CRL 75-36-700-3]|uniref:Uncharacterized protein n=1 Tax=Puccinia graminis f. sp. tritici (strain CRL 75-36-700-3 / race SCCL) TaxID=418459 RepID=H6QRJ0_PUCGT|nr:uncharacterized protein PGTG_21514 [Puccinia graminis f. sp. tritici CRL 75-36-700-3]EHS63298.1 hypothetical protein PGTG_21514 [Puccinia graminis f. sp. tritici CRL 75-36-700-3]